MTTPRDNITRLETALEFLSLARGANERGNPMECERYILKAEELIQRTISAPSPLANMTPAEAVAVQSQTIRERLDCDHLGKVVAERERQGFR